MSQAAAEDSRPITEGAGVGGSRRTGTGSGPAGAGGLREAGSGRTMLALRYYLTVPSRLYTGPGIVVVVAALSLAVGAVIVGASHAEAADVSNGLTYNQTVVWWGSIAPLAILCSAVGQGTTAMLGLGMTRRNVWWGAILYALVGSALTATTLVVLIALERLTHGWFMGLSAIDIIYFGRGSLLTAWLIALGTFFGAQVIALLFTAIYLRAGAMGLTLSIVGTAVLLVVVMGILISAFSRSGQGGAAELLTLGEGLPGGPLPWALGLAVLLSLAGGWLIYRRASFR
jgi:hypothetical protein